VHGSLRDFLASGQRKIDRWYAALNVVECRSTTSRTLFLNINTLDELSRL
jgi:molybdopterin-guanine dinucleotide biosynthesis protein A